MGWCCSATRPSTGARPGSKGLPATTRGRLRRQRARLELRRAGVRPYRICRLPVRGGQRVERTHARWMRQGERACATSRCTADGRRHRDPRRHVDLKYVFVSHAGADSFDWDMGWTGRSQFVVIQQHPEHGRQRPRGQQLAAATPRRRPSRVPRIYNVTMVGSRNPDRAQRAIVVRHGSGGDFRNFVITGFPLESIDLRGEPHRPAHRVEDALLRQHRHVEDRTGRGLALHP